MPSFTVMAIGTLSILFLITCCLMLVLSNPTMYIENLTRTQNQEEWKSSLAKREYETSNTQRHTNFGKLYENKFGDDKTNSDLKSKVNRNVTSKELPNRQKQTSIKMISIPMHVQSDGVQDETHEEASIPDVVATQESPEEYAYPDYRGKGCVDESGFVYAIGDKFLPGPSACPCLCTEEGPLCIQPECPKIHPRCIQVDTSHCCPQCKERKNYCDFRGKTYQPLEEFMVSACEKCRCDSNGEVMCTVSACPQTECVDPVYEPEQCCPVCKNGNNSISK
ncbi:hypothetical protein GDO86_011483 [Hymenochirus boettgeri]|uniref:VWFC domain-containing protein n=1 Tax=Hymenochirus boettgeri TaxID=247094 RepID=A0A8T2JGK6_9PIPI|nr:hypothetical protein GDO86_011483 [Hymenochirus boettgeri]